MSAAPPGAPLAKEAPPIRDLFGVPVAAVTMEEVLARVEEAVATRRRFQIGVVNAAKIVNMQSEEGLRKAVLSSDMILADGMSVVWAARLLRRPLPERVTGIDLMFRIFERGAARGWRIYCFGATDEVIEKVAARVRAEYKGVNLVGYRNGYYKPAEEPAIAAAIAEAKPDILLVAMTSPRKEEFMARYSDRMDVPVCHGVGGSFDVMAGKVERAPGLWQRLGLEWLYRVKQEPGRLWKRYLVTNTRFVGMVVAEVVRCRATAR